MDCSKVSSSSVLTDNNSVLNYSLHSSQPDTQVTCINNNKDVYEARLNDNRSPTPSEEDGPIDVSTPGKSDSFLKTQMYIVTYLKLSNMFTFFFAAVCVSIILNVI